MALSGDEVRKDEELLDIDLLATRKKRFRINGDSNRILELNTSDMNVVSRLNKIYPKLHKLNTKAINIKFDNEGNEEQQLEQVATQLEEIDTEMRSLLDELFDTNVSEVAAPDGSMYDPFLGKFRYEHIIEALLKLYDENFTSEFEMMRKRVETKTSKYIK